MPAAPAPARVRLDKWLWQARFFRTRGLCARAIAAGHVRLNGVPVRKPAQQVAPGDTLTFRQGRALRVVRIVALGTRRGPAAEARGLFEERSPPAADTGGTPRGGPRPTKQARRAIVRLRGG